MNIDHQYVRNVIDSFAEITDVEYKRLLDALNGMKTIDIEGATFVKVTYDKIKAREDSFAGDPELSIDCRNAKVFEIAEHKESDRHLYTIECELAYDLYSGTNHFCASTRMYSDTLRELVKKMNDPHDPYIMVLPDGGAVGVTTAFRVTDVQILARK